MEKQNPPPYSPTDPGFHPPPPGPNVYPNIHPQPPLPQQTVIVTHTTVPLALGPGPAHVTCPSCHAQVTTTVQTEASTKTHLFALLLCLFGLWPCACIPYCTDSCMDQRHYCSNCGCYIGSFTN